MLTATSQIDDARLKDYSLVGRDTALAIERGLAEADWYTSPVPERRPAGTARTQGRARVA